ncbi:LacI family DNA-binding transcriptional regulator [Novosphingobium sp. PhB55]|uniref:LacI family DNA-binding transcriptional regulator n=1 Tax=unclassified Novosphingobium TaxID=2644732 RepID=UPI001065160C|nr:LacI family DNA-binding transcriptional regulator [Novosphingobium sp. PhB55]TDW63034.1 LacI family transcriptional regulator [Novosphingobium sp. PhB55]
MTTIKDVAALAGVSIKTVSRVINRDARVRPKSRMTVEDAIAQLDYRPNVAARQLRAGRSFLIGLMVPRAGVGFMPRLIVALSWAFREHGYQLVTEAVDQGTRLQAFAQMPLAPDIIVTAPRFSNDLEVLGRFEALGIPVVRIAGEENGYGRAINASDQVIARQMVEHLLAQGHRRIGYIGMPLENPMARQRLNGYRQAMLEAGFEPDATWVATRSYSSRDGAEALAAMLAERSRPTAVFAGSDTLAVGVQAMAQKLGYRVPDHLAVAGFEDTPVARAVYPPLTSVNYAVEDFARAIVQVAILGEEPDMAFRHNLIIRGSTSDDRDLGPNLYDE